MEPSTPMHAARRLMASFAACILILLSLSSGAAAAGEPLSLFAGGPQPVGVELVPAGRASDGAIRVAFRFKIDDGWHIYWENPGDAGAPVTVSWSLPSGWRAGPLEQPVPSRFESQGLAGFGYAREVVMFALLTPPGGQPGNHAESTVKAEVSWLACRESCLPGSATLELPGSMLGGQGLAGLEGYLGKIPREAGGSGLQVQSIAPANGEGGEQLVLKLAGPLAGKVSGYFPSPGVKGIRVAGIAVQGDTVVVPLAGEGRPARLEGILAVGPHEGYRFSLPVPYGTPPPAVSGMLGMLLLAFAGGLMLNVMPCVLPVIGLKVFSLIDPDATSSVKGMGGSLFFSFGVFVSFWALALAVIVLKAMGAEVGWGFQFQSPLFVAVMASVVFAFALNLFDLYEFHVPPVSGRLGKAVSSKGSFGAFVSGVLATTLAAPCTAPFLGTALGFAFVQPPLTVLLFFTVIAAGMSLPYVVFAWKPGLLMFLPKPGPWMRRFRQSMGFVLLGVVLWLGSILSGQAGGAAMIGLLAFLLAVGLLLWIAGMLTGSGTSVGRLAAVWLAVLAVLALLFPVLLGSVRTDAARPGFPASRSAGPWKPFTQQSYREALDSGRTVVLEFTADWCLTCRVLEATVLNRRGVVERLGREDVVALKADWTTKNDEVTRLLAGFGRSGVPLVVVIPSGDLSRAEILPELVTEAALVEALDRASGQPR